MVPLFQSPVNPSGYVMELTVIVTMPVFLILKLSRFVVFTGTLPKSKLPDYAHTIYNYS
jgi:hypothetical protein